MTASEYGRTAGRRAHAAVAGVFLVGAALAGCSAQSSEATGHEEPVAIEHAEGSDVARLTLTSQAADRLGLETAPVQQDAGGLRIPYSALLYMADGSTWVYASNEELVFEREPVTVVRIEGDTVLLSDGPAVGTEVATVGAAELFGSEFDTAH
ncbi:hypothetical protein [Naasia sp. SYSU D00057]|uniref:hypothetical protein n=1 Tax=Naasia sp. SYSU D00057 TaxID=2817380 RepID=UPI001B306E5F|nr:hypothetical protein [Naasia sp. SYSU D00057]